jgi:hypothetical protein
MEQDAKLFGCVNNEMLLVQKAPHTVCMYNSSRDLPRTRRAADICPTNRPYIIAVAPHSLIHIPASPSISAAEAPSRNLIL